MRTSFKYRPLAFGSLIIAIIRFIRIMIEFVEERLKEYSQDNPIVKVYHAYLYSILKAQCMQIRD